MLGSREITHGIEPFTQEIEPEYSGGAGVVVVIGTGFGGAVVARRLAQANRERRVPLRIVLLERGRRFEPADFPRLQLPEELTTDPVLASSKRLPEAPRLFWSNDQGLWQIRDLEGLRVATAAGYGGGSLIYASVQLRAPHSVLEDWPDGYRRDDLDRHYSVVESMLDARPAPQDTWTKTQRMKATAYALGREAHFFHPPVAITFKNGANGNDDQGHDNGFGAQQSGCVGCGDCIIGCPHTAKNTLD